MNMPGAGTCFFVRRAGDAFRKAGSPGAAGKLFLGDAHAEHGGVQAVAGAVGAKGDPLPQPAQATVVAAIWVAGTLAVLVLLLRQADPSIPLGLIVRCAITMALIIPAALQLPYRSIQPIITALKRLRGFLK